jgi:acetolactate synthase small subunit
LDKWIFSLKLRNSAGVLAALTALFADRGVSIESLSAQGGGTAGPAQGTAVLTFAASEARKNHLARLLARLASVQEVTEYRYEDANHARKSTLARVTISAEALRARLPQAILCDVVSEQEGQTLALLLGPPPALDSLLAEIAAEDAVLEMDSTVIVV